MQDLGDEQLRFWADNGFVLLSGHHAEAEREEIAGFCQELADRQEAPGKWMKYYESSAHDRSRRLLCRIENFIPYHDGLAHLLQHERTMAILQRLMGEPAVLFKEKVNFKLAGAKGFAYHQDAPAFATFGQTYHVTMMVAVDPATAENGCLQVVAGGAHKRGILPQEADGTLRRDVVAGLAWEPLPMLPGDVLFFDSYLPHGSAANLSQAPRRALYVTYNRASEGDRRADYFAHKRACFPPECERLPGVDYSQQAGIYNLGNPID